MKKNSVFISYSHLDEEWLIEIKKTLSILEFHDKLEVWDDKKINTGNKWEVDIEEAIKRSRVAIMLISTNFLASKFIIKSEMPAILERCYKNGLVIFNILIDVCNFELTPLVMYQFLNDVKYPMEDLSRREKKELMVKLAKEIDRLFKISSDEPSKNSILKNGINDFHLLLILASLKNEAKSITETEIETKMRRKVLFDGLNKLYELGYVEKTKGMYNKKPSIIWKVSALGDNIFSEFELAYNNILIQSPGK